MYVYVYVHVRCSARLRARGGSAEAARPEIGERGSAPKRGRHSKIFVSTKCIRAVAA